MNEEQLRQIVAKVTGSLVTSAPLEQIALEGLAWDSLAQLSFIAECDDLGVRVRDEALATAKTVADLWDATTA